LLLFVLPGLLLFRIAERQLFELLFQLPPRMTRLGPREGRPVASAWLPARHGTTTLGDQLDF
jgi:hypothetical protein